MNFPEILSLFRQGKGTAKSHMKNLIEMAAVDGNFHRTGGSVRTARHIGTGAQLHQRRSSSRRGATGHECLKSC